MYITVRDGTQIYYKEWGTGPPVVFCHGWPLTADSWESQMVFLASKGFRCIAHDRRGHGRSSQPWRATRWTRMPTISRRSSITLDVKAVTLIGFSTGGGEVARYIGRHGTNRVAKAVLVSAVPPLMLKTAANPGGLPIEVFDGLRAASLADRSQFFKDVPSGPFFGFNRPGAKVSQGMIDSWWLQGMMGGHKNTYECIKAFSETDFTEDLKKFDVPTLIIHGDDDQVVPIDARRTRLGEARQGREADRLRRRAARHHRHAQGSAQRGPARVHRKLIEGARTLARRCVSPPTSPAGCSRCRESSLRPRSLRSTVRSRWGTCSRSPGKRWSRSPTDCRSRDSPRSSSASSGSSGWDA